MWVFHKWSLSGWGTISSSWSVFIVKGCWILSDAFSTEMTASSLVPYSSVVLCAHSVVSDSDLQPTRLPSTGFFRQEYWSGLPFFSSRGSSGPRDRMCVSCIAGGSLLMNHQGSHSSVRLDYTDLFLYVKANRGSWNKSHWVITCNPFYMLLDLVH